MITKHKSTSGITYWVLTVWRLHVVWTTAAGRLRKGPLIGLRKRVDKKPDIV